MTSPTRCLVLGALLTFLAWGQSAADIYTVGANLFQTLSGRNPLEFFGGLANPQPRAIHLNIKLLQGKCRPALVDIIHPPRY